MKTLLRCLCLLAIAAPASAAPLTLNFTGHVTGFSNGSLDFFDFTSSLDFAATLTFADPDNNPDGPNVLYYADVAAGGATVEALGPIQKELVPASPSMQLTTMPGRMLTPLPAGAGLYITWLQFDMDPGWQTGTFNIWAEGLFGGRRGTDQPVDTVVRWTGDLSPVTSVPEPSSLALAACALGLAFASTRRFASRRQVA